MDPNEFLRLLIEKGHAVPSTVIANDPPPFNPCNPLKKRFSELIHARAKNDEPIWYADPEKDVEMRALLREMDEAEAEV